jgi:SAM-dependent methyltransferase
MKISRSFYFLRSHPYLEPIFKGKPSWITPVIHFRIFGIKPILSLLLRIPLLREKFLELDWEVWERVVENTWLYRFLDQLSEQARILDVGCVESLISFELATMGYKVTGIDMRDYDYPLAHPNFSFFVGDICKMPFANEFFDMIMAISTIEHVGLPSYGLSAFPEGDKKSLVEIHRCLKPNGLLYITLPFGVKRITWLRIYDSQSLIDLLKNFDILVSKYYQCFQDKLWLPTTARELERMSSSKEDGEGVVIMLCRKLPD